MAHKLTTYAWAAGIIDGEGCISISFGARKARRGPNLTYFAQLYLKVGMTHYITIDKLQEIFGGGVHIHKALKPLKHKPSKTWTVTDRNAVIVLKKILPFLVTKVNQARLAIQFFAECRGFWSMRTPPELTALRKKFHLEMKALNRKGPHGK